MNNNKGIFIDIFPLDVVPDSFVLREKHRKKLRRIKWLVDTDMAVRANIPNKKKWRFITKKTINSAIRSWDFVFRYEQ